MRLEAEDGYVLLRGSNAAEPIHLNDELKECLSSAERVAFVSCTISKPVLDFLVQISQAGDSPFYRLAISSSSLNSKLLTRIGEMTSISRLLLMNPVTHSFKPQMRDLEGLTRLKRVRFEGIAEFGDPALERLADFPNLETIQVLRSSVTGTGLRALSTLAHLDSLWLDEAPLKVGCFAGCRFPELTCLGTAGALSPRDLYSINWYGLAPKLEEIWMDPARVTDDFANRFEEELGIKICFAAALEDLESTERAAS